MPDGPVIDVEQRALVPERRFVQAAFAPQPLEKRRARKRRQHGHLDFQRLGLADEAADVVEDGRRVVVQPDDEARVDRHSGVLDRADGVDVAVEAAGLPAGGLDRREVVAREALQPDEKLVAAGRAQGLQQVRVVGDRRCRSRRTSGRPAGGAARAVRGPSGDRRTNCRRRTPGTAGPKSRRRPGSRRAPDRPSSGGSRARTAASRHRTRSDADSRATSGSECGCSSPGPSRRNRGTGDCRRS